MSYPINPPAMMYCARQHIPDGVEVAPGIVRSKIGWFHWEPVRAEKKPDDWLVGPYTTKRAAVAAQAKFIRTQADGDELRAWAV